MEKSVEDHWSIFFSLFFFSVSFKDEAWGLAILPHRPTPCPPPSTASRALRSQELLQVACSLPLHESMAGSSLGGLDASPTSALMVRKL